MIVLLTLILIISVISSCWCVYCFLDIKKREKEIDKASADIIELYKNMASITSELSKIKETPMNMNNKFSLYEFRLKKMEDTLSTFNNGFRYQESWMR